jgi:hypothetical protein
MSYNGTGTFVINTTGQPVVTGTVISSSVFNALTSDLATGLSTAITKDGQTTITNNIPFSNNKITGLGVATTSGDALSYGQAATVSTLTVSGLTSGRVPYATTAGLLTDSANLTFNGTTLTANTIGAFTLSGTIAGGGNQLNNIIIGTSTPLAGSFTTVSASTSVTTPSVTNAGTLALSATGANIMTASTNGSERMRIDSSGNVGIGTTGGTYGLDLARSATNGSTIRVYNSTASAGTLLQVDTSGVAYLQQQANAALVFATNNTERMRINSSGNLLVNTTSQISQGQANIAFNGTGNQGLNLQETVNQSSAGFMYFQYSTTVLGTITRDAATNAVKYNTTSDIRLKENIKDSAPALDTVSNIKVRQYDWIGCENSHQDYGFIAQELAEVVNNVVSHGRTEEDMWAVDYGKLTPLLCKAIQELNAKVAGLEAKLNQGA